MKKLHDCMKRRIKLHPDIVMEISQAVIDSIPETCPDDKEFDVYAFDEHMLIPDIDAKIKKITKEIAKKMDALSKSNCAQIFIEPRTYSINDGTSKGDILLECWMQYEP